MAMRAFMVFSLLVATAATPGMAQETAAPALQQPELHADPQESGQAAAPVAEAKKAEKVCKVIAVTGSRFRSKQCYTQHEWDTIDRAHKDKMREIDGQAIKQRGD